MAVLAASGRSNSPRLLQLSTAQSAATQQATVAASPVVLGGLIIVNSTISGNSAGDSGGGIAGFVAIMNSTISGNSAGDRGGGIFGSADVRNSTVSGNSAVSGGGIYNIGEFSTLISNTILNAGASGENIFNNGGTVTSHGYNISSDNGGGYLNGPGDQINTDPLLGPLQDNGGPTLTHAPLPGSPAIDAGDPNFTPPPLRDQRGRCFYRVFGRRIDIGSVEIQPRSTVSDSSTAPNSALRRANRTQELLTAYSQRFRQGRRGVKDFHRRSRLVGACAGTVLRASEAPHQKGPSRSTSSLRASLIARMSSSNFK